MCRSRLQQVGGSGAGGWCGGKRSPELPTAHALLRHTSCPATSLRNHPPSHHRCRRKPSRRRRWGMARSAQSAPYRRWLCMSRQPAACRPTGHQQTVCNTERGGGGQQGGLDELGGWLMPGVSGLELSLSHSHRTRMPRPTMRTTCERLAGRQVQTCRPPTACLQQHPPVHTRGAVESKVPTVCARHSRRLRIGLQAGCRKGGMMGNGLDWDSSW